MRELTRRVEGGRCRRCCGWFLRRHGFGLDQQWCARACWLASPQRRALHARSARVFQSGQCTECDSQFTVLIGSPDAARSSGGRFCSESCHNRHRRRQYKINRRARVCPGCLIRTASYGKGLTRTIGMLCDLCQRLAIYACLSKTRFADRDTARDQPQEQRVYRCLLCDGWHRSSTARSITSGDSDVMRRLAPLYDRLALDPQIKAALIYSWRLRRGAVV